MAGRERLIGESLMPTELDFSFDVSVSGESLLAGNGQLERVAWVSKRIRRDDFFFLQDGSFSKLLFEELVGCFVNGHFIATCALGYSLIERTIAGRLSHQGESSLAGKMGGHLLQGALDRGWITREEFDDMESLRKVRNPMVHFKPQSAQNRPEVRANACGLSTAQLLEADAKRILEAAIKVLGKTAV